MVSGTLPRRSGTSKTILHRTAFTTSRALGFFSEKELAMQLGFAADFWPIALLKELLDNALDACETAGVAPEITVEVAPQTLTVRDNGPGLPRQVLERSLDYLVRISDKAHYASPSRGQLGNALKCLWAAPYVLSAWRHGRVDVATGGVRYQIDVTVDALAQEPQLVLTTHEDAMIKSGTSITVHWSEEASYPRFPDGGAFYHPALLLAGYAMFNPHATFAYQVPGHPQYMELPARMPGWNKWVPSRPTSPHWYTPRRFEQLLAAYLVEDRQTGRGRTVRELLAEFDGLTGVQARVDVQAAAGLSRATLADLVQGDRLDTAAISRLLRAMKDRARPVKPEALGVLGQPHVTAVLMGDGVDADTLTYRCAKGVVEGLPYVLELACGWGQAADGRTLFFGYNHAPTLQTPFVRLPIWLQRAEIDPQDPVTLLVHLVYPRLEATNRAKTSVTLPWELDRVVQETLLKVTQRWTKLKQQVRRAGRRQALLEDRERRQQRPLSTKEAAWQVMEAAYLKASDNGRLVANARQIMYAARGDVIRLTGKATPWKHSSYFTQRLLPDFLAEHPELTATWDVVFDARGHFREPHTGTEIGLGTLEVRDYMRSWTKTLAPRVEALQLPHRITT
jgi:DNA topoisomerase VI subunit B